MPCPNYLDGRTLRISYMGYLPFVGYWWDPVDGADFRIVRLLAEKFNFKSKMNRSDTFGSYNKETGKWNGLVHEVRVS